MRIPSSFSGVSGLPEPKKMANMLTVGFILLMIMAVLGGVDFKSIAQDAHTPRPVAALTTH